MLKRVLLRMLLWMLSRRLLRIQLRTRRYQLIKTRCKKKLKNNSK